MKNQMIVLDGIDGAGKGVQSIRLLKAFQQAHLPTILTREPGGSPAAEEIRKLLVTGEPEKWDSLTELLLMYAARRSHLRDTIWPALALGQWVISDRFADSSRAFQGIAGELGFELVEQVHRITVADFEPSLVLILDIPESIALKRTMARGQGEDRFEKKGQVYYATVRRAFKQIASRYPDRYRLIHADQPINQVTQQILDAVNPYFGLSLQVDDH